MSQEETHVWFSGPVTEAVKSVTEKNLVFLVYIHGKHNA